tara:strand:- start:2144 stop:2443 length:300 start_codon:yes stop_codon:yes gene_type:complete
MSTSSKKKTQKKNDTIGNKDNNVAKVNTTGYAPLREQTVAGHMGVSKSIAAKNKTERLKKEAAGGYKSVPLSKKPVGVAFREIFNKPPKLKQKKKKGKK